MTTALTVAFVVGMLTIPALVLDWWDRRRASKAHARAIHPGTLPPGVGWAATFDDATEQAIEQAVGIVDDGAALVRETEDYLRRRLR